MPPYPPENAIHPSPTKETSNSDLEKQHTHLNSGEDLNPQAPKTLGAGVSFSAPAPHATYTYIHTYRHIDTNPHTQTALAIGVFGTTLTTLSLSLMEWRGVTITNVYVANFFFAAAFGLVVTAQWELSVGNGFAYTVFSAFGECVSMSVYRLKREEEIGWWGDDGVWMREC